MAARICPTDEDLVRMIEGDLARDTLLHIESHVDGCAQCASVVAGLGALGATTALPSDHRELLAVDPQHYVLDEEIARGGMGRILRARDRRLGREIAIKENFGKIGTPARRFEREARITARLQHPSIVQVHEAGVWPSGEPFFAMQLVSGRSLDVVIAGATTLDKRLALLPNVLAVADAIAYAHSQSVIHRDLKPKNVLVGDFGETVVIDWGLAKDMTAVMPELVDGPFRTPSTPDGHTAVGTVMGTPAYMPPEQALGDSVDERADVYALGALLFHVLAGRPPVTGRTTDEVLAKIVAGPLPSLADTQPDVPADLLAIVAKAMAFELEDRYPSARELAGDLRRFQTGKLVSAHHYSLGQLVRRWLGRHRSAVIVAAAAAVVLVAVGIVSVHKIVRAEHVAQTERAAAEQHRADAEELMSFMLGDLRDKLQPIGKLDVLDAVAKKAIGYYERRPEGSGDREHRQRAIALDNLGEVLLAQGHTAAALAQYRAALAMTAALAAADPGNVTLQRDLSIRHARVGEALATQGDAAGALAEYRADMAIAARLAARDPSNATWQRDLSVSHEKLADMLEIQGQTAAALVEYQASLAISEHLAAVAPSANAERDLSVGHERLGEVHAAHGDVAAALGEQRAALALRVRLVAADPRNMQWQRDLSGSHNMVGELLETQGDHAGASAEFRAAIAIDEGLAARDPSNADWQSDLAFSHGNLAKTLRKQGDLAGGLVEYRAALVIQDTLAAADPSHADRQRDLEISHKGIGELLQAQENAAAAIVEYQVTLAIATKLAARDPSNAIWQRDLAMAYEKIAHVHELLADMAAALDEYRACLAIRERLAASDPSNTAWQNDVAVSHYNIAEVLAKTDVTAALAEHRAAMSVTEKLVAHDPSNTAWQHDLADSHETIAGLLSGDNRRAELAAARAVLERLVTADPTNADWRAELAKLRR